MWWLEIDEDDRVVTVCNKNEIERLIIKHNKSNFTKVKSTKAHNDKMCSEIKEDEMRDDGLNGEFIRDECDDENVHQFLLLCKDQID